MLVCVRHRPTNFHKNKKCHTAFQQAEGMVVPSETDALLTPGKLGDLTLKNRVIYPAMTRGRCAGRVPVEENVKYYTARASAGMIVTEPSAVSELANGFHDAPGMYSEEQARGWSQVTRALHDEGCTVVCQLWHTGRMSHSTFRNGATPVAPSAIGVTDVNGVPACGVQVRLQDSNPHPGQRCLPLMHAQSALRTDPGCRRRVA